MVPLPQPQRHFDIGSEQSFFVHRIECALSASCQSNSQLGESEDGSPQIDH